MRWSAKLSGALLPIVLAASAAAQSEPASTGVAAVANGKTAVSSEVRDRMREILAEASAASTEEASPRDRSLTDLISKRPPRAEERTAEASEGEAEGEEASATESEGN